MCCASSDEYFSDPVDVGTTRFEEVQAIVQSEFNVEESFVEHGVPTFHIKYQQDSKNAFLRLIKHLDAIELIPLLRQKEEKVVLQIIAKPPIKPNRNIINIALFLATLGTVFLSGYVLSASDITGAILFTGAIMAILGSHEMGHKILADKHDVAATYPYFIPSPPPPCGIGTFGAVIRQKAIPPNRDALFDIGFTGPLMSFIFSVPFIAIGLIFSSYDWRPIDETGLAPSLLTLLIGTD